MPLDCLRGVKAGEAEKEDKGEEEMSLEEACEVREGKKHLAPIKFLFEQYGRWW